MKSVKEHPRWNEFRETVSNLTGFYENEENLYIAEEAHRRFGSLTQIPKAMLFAFLDRLPLEDDGGGTDEEWDTFFEQTNKLERIFSS